MAGLAVVGGKLVSGGIDENSHVWDLHTGQHVAIATGYIKSIAALSGGRFATVPHHKIQDTRYDTPNAAVWDAATAKRICELDGKGKIKCIAPVSGDLVAIGSDDKVVYILRADTGDLDTALVGHNGTVEALAMLPDGRLASGSSDNTLRLWDHTTGTPGTCAAVLQHDARVSALAVLEGGCLASGCADYNIYVWNTTSGEREALLEGHTKCVSTLAALPQGLLASGGGDKTVRVWNVVARSCVAVLQGHTEYVNALAALPDGRLASGDNDGAIRVWELRH